MRLTVDISYNKNKYFKVPLEPADTASAADICIACGAPLHDLITVELASGAPVLVRAICRSCGYSPFRRMPSQAWTSEFYRQQWDQRRSDDDVLVKSRIYYPELLEVLLPCASDRGMRILEVGTGYGGMLAHLQSLGYQNLRGTEASEKRAQGCRELHGLDVALCTAENLLDDDGVRHAAPYDIVYCWHVFEHTYRPEMVLRGIRELLAPGGKLILGVPHFDQEHLLYLGHFLPHLHSFTPQSLQLLLERCGFAITHIDHQIRVIAEKLAAEPVAKASTAVRMTRTEPRDALAQKMKRDFGLDDLAPGTHPRSVYGTYRMSKLQPSVGWLTGMDRLGARERATLRMKFAVIGPGANVRSILHPRFQPANLFDPGNLARNILLRSMRFSSHEFGGSVDLQPDTDGEQIRVIYPGTSAFAWLK